MRSDNIPPKTRAEIKRVMNQIAGESVESAVRAIEVQAARLGDELNGQAQRHRESLEHAFEQMASDLAAVGAFRERPAESGGFAEALDACDSIAGFRASDPASPASDKAVYTATERALDTFLEHYGAHPDVSRRWLAAMVDQRLEVQAARKRARATEDAGR